MLGTVGARAQGFFQVAAFRLPQDSVKVLVEDIIMSSDTSDFGISAQRCSRSDARLCCESACQLPTLPCYERSTTADRLRHILAWHFMHIRYAPPSGSCSHAYASLKTL